MSPYWTPHRPRDGAGGDWTAAKGFTWYENASCHKSTTAFFMNKAWFWTILRVTKIKVRLSSDDIYILNSTCQSKNMAYPFRLARFRRKIQYASKIIKPRAIFRFDMTTWALPNFKLMVRIHQKHGSTRLDSLKTVCFLLFSLFRGYLPLSNTSGDPSDIFSFSMLEEWILWFSTDKGKEYPRDEFVAFTEWRECNLLRSP